MHVLSSKRVVEIVNAATFVAIQFQIEKPVRILTGFFCFICFDQFITLLTAASFCVEC